MGYQIPEQHAAEMKARWIEFARQATLPWIGKFDDLFTIGRRDWRRHVKG
jgi:hypothetical protein